MNLTTLNIDETATVERTETLASKLWQATVWLLLDADIQPVEVGLALFSAAWVYSVARSADLFASIPLYRLIEAAGISAPLVGTIAAVLLVTSVTSFITHPNYQEISFKMRRWAMIGYAGFHSGLTVGISWALPEAPSAGYGAILSAAAIWGYWRLRRRRRSSSPSSP